MKMMKLVGSLLVLTALALPAFAQWTELTPDPYGWPYGDTAWSEAVVNSDGTPPFATVDRTFSDRVSGVVVGESLFCFGGWANGSIYKQGDPVPPGSTWYPDNRQSHASALNVATGVWDTAGTGTILGINNGNGSAMPTSNMGYSWVGVNNGTQGFDRDGDGIVDEIYLMNGYPHWAPKNVDRYTIATNSYDTALVYRHTQGFFDIDAALLYLGEGNVQQTDHAKFHPSFVSWHGLNDARDVLSLRSFRWRRVESFGDLITDGRTVSMGWGGRHYGFGRAAATPPYDAVMFDFTDGSRLDVAQPAFAVAHAMVVKYDGLIYFCGGRTGGLSASHDKIQIYNPAADVWYTSTTAMPSNTHGGAAGVVRVAGEDWLVVSSGQSSLAAGGLRTNRTWKIKMSDIDRGVMTAVVEPTPIREIYMVLTSSDGSFLGDLGSRPVRIVIKDSTGTEIETQTWSQGKAPATVSFFTKETQALQVYVKLSGTLSKRFDVAAGSTDVDLGTFDVTSGYLGDVDDDPSDPSFDVIDDSDLTNVILDFGLTPSDPLRYPFYPSARQVDADGNDVVDDADITYVILNFGAEGDL